MNPAQVQAQGAGNDSDEEDKVTYCRKCHCKTKDGGDECGRCHYTRYLRLTKKVRKATQRELKSAADEEFKAHCTYRQQQARVRSQQARQATALLLHQQLAALAVQVPALVLVPAPAPAPAAPAPAPAPAAAAPAPMNANDPLAGVPPQQIQNAVNNLRANFPQGGATIAGVRALPGCPPNVPDIAIARLIVLAGVGAVHA